MPEKGDLSVPQTSTTAASPFADIKASFCECSRSGQHWGGGTLI